MAISSDPTVRAEMLRGRGAVSNRSGRFERFAKSIADDGWGPVQGTLEALAELPRLRTEVTDEHPKHIITKNASPDIPFDRSINPYRGCEHGCVYCFARPTHTYHGLSAGLDFETKLFAKPDAADLLKTELAKKGYAPAPIAMGTNTDPYQPIERERGITRALLEVLDKASHPVTIVTKSRLVVRDIDILSRMAERNLVKVALSVTTVDPKLARTLEPRAATPQRRLDAIRLLTDAGVPTGVMMAPVIPAINDHEMERVLAAAAHAGAREAGYILVRLPLEVAGLFEEWLETNYPDRKDRVLSRLAAMRGGRLNDPRFGNRMKGEGLEAELLRQRFALMCKRFGYNKDRIRLDTGAFEPPLKPARGGQMDLFG
ncbi:PA0069 family radical SAM protein [Gimibacter soli]|uniref:PA0069 family radical SAM protein n=1 Tax=Gimibacter soli TaxID=3024400 RepID=A0AAF0BLH7_9PROT|nr:PA0069 family radical SAM protein [Gimibacter soli]WCL55499.1 PA0069 family radical SAM protein [Gimibacter soli]